MSKFIITGASSGIGNVINKALKEASFEIMNLSRRSSDHPFDLNQEEEVLNWKPPKDIDGLICCAGIGYFKKLEELSFSEMQEMMRTNFFSHAVLCKKVLPILKKKSRAHLIFIGSEAALKGSRFGSMYCASKFALRGFVQSLVEECSNTSVHISLIQPGMVDTPFYDELHFKPGDAIENSIDPQTIAQMVLHCIKARKGTELEEIIIRPKKKVVQFKKELAAR